MPSDNAAVSGSIADRSNFMSKCRCVKKKWKVHQPGTKEISGKHEIGLNYVVESSRKSSVKQCP